MKESDLLYTPASALWQAKEANNLGPLAARLRNPRAPLSVEERRYLADKIEGKLKKKSAHRPKSTLLAMRRLEVAKFVMACEINKLQEKMAVFLAMDRFKIKSARTVRQHVSTAKKENAHSLKVWAKQYKQALSYLPSDWK